MVIDLSQSWRTDPASEAMTGNAIRIPHDATLDEAQRFIVTHLRPEGSNSFLILVRQDFVIWQNHFAYIVLLNTKRRGKTAKRQEKYRSRTAHPERETSTVLWIGWLYRIMQQATILA
jgi:hypothetical protein